MTTPLTFESLGDRAIAHSTAEVALDPRVLQTLLDHIPMRATAVSRDRRYLYANRAFLDAMGLRIEQVVGHPIADVLGQAIADAYIAMAERLFAGEALRWEGWMDYVGRGARYYEQHLLPYTDASGAVTAIITFGRDVTELKQRELELAAKLQELQTSEALKSAIVDHALVALITADQDGRIVDFNPAAEAMFGRARADVIGRNVSDVAMPERFRGPHQAGMQRMLAGGAPPACNACWPAARRACSASASNCMRCAPTAASFRSRWCCGAPTSRMPRCTPHRSSTSPSA